MSEPANKTSIDVVLGAKFIKRLIDAKIIPHNCSRLIIDCQVGGVVTLYYRTFATTAGCDVILDATLDVFRGGDV